MKGRGRGQLHRTAMWMWVNKFLLHFFVTAIHPANKRTTHLLNVHKLNWKAKWSGINWKHKIFTSHKSALLPVSFDCFWHVQHICGRERRLLSYMLHIMHTFELVCRENVNRFHAKRVWEWFFSLFDNWNWWFDGNSSITSWLFDSTSEDILILYLFIIPVLFI